MKTSRRTFRDETLTYIDNQPDDGVIVSDAEYESLQMLLDDLRANDAAVVVSAAFFERLLHAVAVTIEQSRRT